MRLELKIQRVTQYSSPSTRELRHWAIRALEERHKATTLVIRLVDESESAELNQTYRHKQGPTNVLSFPFIPPPRVRSKLIGDLVICAPVVIQEAAQQGKLIQAHWAHLVIHGVLHLLGYDHLDDAQAQLMECREQVLLAALGYADPYAVNRK